MLYLYQIVLAVALVVAGPVLLIWRGRHYLPTLIGRLGGHHGTVHRRALWIHCVSVGEARVGATLARSLPEDWPLVVTTVTPTGQAQARALLGERAAVAYLPFDLGLPVRRFLDRFTPRALVLVEGDYWPVLLRHVRRRGLPVVVVNGRVSERSYRRMARFRRAVRVLLGRVDRFAVQTTDDRERLVGLGVEPGRIVVTGNLKFDAEPPPALPAVEAVLQGAAAERPILLAGSTMGGEEEQLLDAFVAAGGAARALLVLAPRHPERWNEVAQLVERRGLAVMRRSQMDGTSDGESDGDAVAASPPAVVLLDSLGELAALYRIARAAFVGGTLVPTGGHNPLEPAVQGVPVAVGPSMENFRQIAEAFDTAAAWQRVADAGELGEFFGLALDGADGVDAMARRGSELVAANRGATQRTLAAIRPLLDEALS